MIFRIILLGILSIAAVQCRDSGSDEANKFEISQIYDTIILSDVADIFNDLENGLNPLEALFNSASDSEENLEDLLIEYQHYLDRAHDQRMNYLEKTKTKNKVPLVRHDRFAKTKPAGGMKYDDYYYTGSYANTNKLPYPQTQYAGPLDAFMPVNQNLRYISKSDLNPSLLTEEYQPLGKRMLSLPPVIPKSRLDTIISSCLCKSAQLPCDCKCKQCLIYDSATQNYYPHPKYSSGDSDNSFTSNAELEDKFKEENTLNIRIKVDIQLPKTKDFVTRMFKHSSPEQVNSKETTVSIPFPNFNFPVPLDLFGFTKPSKVITRDPSHKITIHKKKKSRANNSSKKHKKRVIAFHNLQPQHAKIQPYFDETTNTTIDYSEKVTEASTQTTSNSTIAPTTRGPEYFDINTNKITVTNNTKDNTIPTNETQTEQSISITVNISNSIDNYTEDPHKTENSVETEFTKDASLPTAKLMLRKKRNASSNNQDVTKKTTSEPANTYSAISKMVSPLKNNNENKKSDKARLADSELVYWPINKILTDYTSKNITTIILEREDKKAKLNMTKEAIRNNRTTALEKAIFGDVNWDDVDTVAPVFLSFVGKYMRGVLTFCSENVCHSMRCAQKTCVHRICHPSDRWNQRGHCAGSNKTDSVASLESIMDLPSNVAFEIVDILQDKMLGKLFGKVTLCINSKCITFVAVKKSFLKSKCSVKVLKAGHCPNVKSFKIM